MRANLVFLENNCFMKYLLTLFLCAGLWISANSQNTVSGRVIDSLTREPVPFANVFFANTSIGTTTSETGEFELKDFQSGKYDLVVSFVGYRSIKHTLLFSGASQTLKILLRQEAQQLDEVVVKAGFSQKASDIRKFKKYFIGDNKNATTCEILNPADLVAYEDTDQNTLLAFGRAPLEIKNDALGYKIFYTLETFEVNFNARTQTYAGFPRFEMLVPRNLAQQRRWEAERKRAYEGSFSHLIHFLRKGVMKGPFVMHELYKTSNPNRPSEEFLKERIAHWRKKYLSTRGTVNNNRLALDSAKYYTNLYNLPEQLDSLGLLITRPGQIMDETREHIIYKGMLYVTYTGEAEEPEYIKMNRKSNGNEQHSIIQFTGKPVAIYANGYYEDIKDVFFDGYMMWSDRTSNLLPREYIPEK
jgi:CarboxypepD_reg-like domain